MQLFVRSVFANWHVVLLLIFVFATQGLAQDVRVAKVVLGPFAKGLNVRPGIVAKGHRLWGTELDVQDLRKVSFDDCDLTGVAFRECDLTGCTFRNALMTGLTIENCTFGENDFSNAVINGILYASSVDSDQAMGMNVAQLKTTWSYKNKNLDHCAVPENKETERYDFTDFSLKHTTFNQVSNSVFVHARIERSAFLSCNLLNCVFDKAVLMEVSFNRCRVSQEQLRAAELFSAVGCKFLYTELSNFSNSNLQVATISVENGFAINYDNAIVDQFKAIRAIDGRNLARTLSYKVGNLSLIQLFECDLSATDFSSQYLRGATFEKCDLTDCKFDDAVISEASFISCKGITAKQIQSTWNYKQGRMDGIKLYPNILNEK